ncbi:hypothetical protein EH223_08480 [candidate division KSB1 bacterium]|nr:MAG: hypothetical protein EH223_08480 [candidate division KSB1 bacterium]
MAIIKSIPLNSAFIQRNVIFTGTFNVPTLGVYDFNVAGNTDVVLLAKLNPDHIYMFERYSFSATLDEGVFLSAINTMPTIGVKMDLNRASVYQYPMPLGNYVDGQEAVAYFKTDKPDDTLRITMRGVLNQVAAMVGIATVRAIFTCNIYDISDSKWCQEFRREVNIGAGDYK